MHRKRNAKPESNAEMSSTHSRLMALPAELRNTIYEYALIEERPIIMRLRRDRRDDEPALVITSKQVRRETRALYYRRNEFQLKLHLIDFGLAAKWLAFICKQLGPRAFGKLQFAVQSEPEWRLWTDMPSIFPLLLLEFQGTIDLDVDLITGRPRARVTANALYAASPGHKPDPSSLYVMCARTRLPIKILNMLSGEAICVQRALENLTEMARKARQFSWSEQKLQQEFWKVHNDNIVDFTWSEYALKKRLATAEQQRLSRLHENYQAE